MLTIPDVLSRTETAASKDRLRRSLTHPAARAPAPAPAPVAAAATATVLNLDASLTRLREEREDVEFRLFAASLLAAEAEMLAHKATLTAELRQLEEAEACLRRQGSQWKRAPPPGPVPLM